MVANALYWVAGAITPNPYISSAASLMLLMTSAGMFVRYAPAAFDVVINGLRDTGDGGENSHIALYGATLVAAGSCYVGLFGFLWVMADQPDNWLGTPFSGYGRAVSACGFALMALSPDKTPAGVRLPNIFLIILLILAVAVGSFFAGTKAAPKEQAVYWRTIEGRFANSPVCPPDKQIWVSANGIYHTPGSVYRDEMAPKKCFETTAEAKENGFRPPR